MEESIVTEFTTEYQKETRGERFRNSFKNMSSVRQILLWYLIISLTGALLLWMPFAHTKEFNEANGAFGLSFIDALFVSSSAFSDTGLSPVGIEETFNFFGEFVTLILLQVGGVGWFTIKIFIITFILRKATNYNTIADGSSELGTAKKHETLGIIYTAIFISLGASFIGGFIFSLIFFFTGVQGIGSYLDALWTGIYHASASINNSGLDIFTGNDSMNSLYGDGVGAAGFNVGWEVTIEIITMFLFILGGMGFGIIYDLWSYRKAKGSGRSFSFSVVTKISVVAYVSVAFIGLGLTYLSEGLAILGNSQDAFLSNDWIGTTSKYGAIQIDDVGLTSGIHEIVVDVQNNGFTSDTPNELVDVVSQYISHDVSFYGTSTAFRWWTVTFNTFSTRNAGFATMDLAYVQESTKLIYSAMMFIGSGPGSTAGGLRTTTFAIIIVSLWTSARNKPQVYTFNKGVPQEVVRKAYAILCLSLGLIFIDTFLISVIEYSTGHSANSFIDNMFVVFSAYGTTGLSIADLGTYNWLSKLILILLMFIGQMGISNTLGQVRAKQNKYQRQYVEEHINLG